MDSQKRLWLALALSFGMTSVYMMWFAPKASVPSPQSSPSPSSKVLPAAVEPSIPRSASLPPSDKARAREEVPSQVVERELGQLKLVVSNDGGGLTQASLMGPKMREQPRITFEEGLRALIGKKLPEGPPVDMAFAMAGHPSALSVSVQSAEQAFPAQARYQVQERPDGTLALTAHQGDVEVVKTFQWPTSGFDFAMDVQVRNTGARALRGELAINYARGVEEGAESKPSFFGGVGNETAAACDIGTDLRRHVADGKPPAEFKGPLNFFGMNQQYFLAAVFPLDGPKEGRCVLSASPTGRVATAFFPLDLQPGGSYHQRFGVFIGPKDLELLRSVPERMKPLGFSVATAETSWSLNGSSYPHLEKAVDFGMWAFICKILLGILKFFHGLVRNWGVAIILLTVVVKLALLPATHKSMVSAEAMKKLQPKMEEIRKKFAQDKERQNAEMMKLYQQEKVNPLGGCLPMLLQMPIWFALYTTLRNSYEIYREPFIVPFWADLTFRDPTYLLPVALGITQIVTQRLQPQMMDAAQAKMMTYVMPVFFTLVMINYPAGLSLYIFTNNLLTVAQQYGLRRYLSSKSSKDSKAQADRHSRRDVHGRQPSRKRSDP